jgi:hypothetical protein
VVKNADDFKKLKWLFENTLYHFDKENFELGSKFIGNRGEPQFYLPRSPYQCFIIEWTGLENLIYALADIPGKVEEVMKALDKSYRPQGDMNLEEIKENIGDKILIDGIPKGAKFEEGIKRLKWVSSYCQTRLTSGGDAW